MKNVSSQFFSFDVNYYFRSSSQLNFNFVKEHEDKRDKSEQKEKNLKVTLSSSTRPVISGLTAVGWTDQNSIALSNGHIFSAVSNLTNKVNVLYKVLEQIAYIMIM